MDFSTCHRILLLLPATVIASMSPIIACASISISTNTADFLLTPESLPIVSTTIADLVSVSGKLTVELASGVGNPAANGHLNAELGGPASVGLGGVMPGAEYAVAGDENFNLKFSSPQNAFAMNYADDSFESIFTLNFFNGLSNVGSTTFTSVAPFDTAKFIGFLSDTSFNRVEIREDDGSLNSNEFFQFFTAESALSNVPEMGAFTTWSLLFTVAFWRRSRSKRD